MKQEDINEDYRSRNYGAQVHGTLGGSLDRAKWAAYADRLLLSLRPFASQNQARFQLPGPRSGLGHAVDGLEAFTRSLLIAGFRLAGEHGQDPLGLAEWYATGISAGTDPQAPDRWVTLPEHPQAKVEAASLALILDLTRPWLWDRLDSSSQERVIAYLAPAVGDQGYHRNNWLWFRLVVQTFLRSVGGPHDLGEMAADLELHDSFIRADGWLADGPTRAFDHYTGWALHFYPILWARMAGAEELSAPRAGADIARLDRYLTDAIRLVGADGSPLLQGRSLVYRFATAAPFWVGALAEVPSVPAGQLRRAASRILGHFADHGVPNADGLLSMGWFHEWDQLAQSYSGSGSPYWAAKGLLGLALPADHPAWTEAELGLPAETGDELFQIEAAGWIASSTVADGVVRISNHGTDHGLPGESTGDSPLYARLGYSTATMPHLDDDAWLSPVDNSVVLLDASGRATHRTGWDRIELRVDDTPAGALGIAASLAHSFWLEAEPADYFNPGYGLTGQTSTAGKLLLVSLLRGPWEIRLARLSEPSPEAMALRIGGWPVHTDSGLSSRLEPLTRPATLDHDERTGASALADQCTTPLATFPVTDGAWVAALVELTGAPVASAPAAVAVASRPLGITIQATWPDGLATSTLLDHPLFA